MERTPRRRSPDVKRTLLCVLCLVPGAAAADSIIRDLSVSAGFGASDNIGGLYVDQVSETVAAAGIEARLERQTRRSALSLDTDLQYLSYLGGSFDDEIAGTASLEGKLFLVEDRLSWVLEDFWGQIQIAPFAPITPENREDTNVLATGPELRWDLSADWALLASGRVMRETYELSNADNDRRFAQVGITHQSSRNSSIAVLVNSQSVEFIDESLGTDFDRSEALVRYQLRTSRTLIQADIGRTELSEVGSSRRRWLARIDIERKITRKMTVDMMVGQEPSDAGSLFADAQAAVEPSRVGLGGGARLPPIGNGGIISVADSLENQFVGAGWRLNASRTVATASAEYRRERYTTRAEIDRSIRILQVGVARDLSSTLQLAVEARDLTTRAQVDGTVLRDFLFQVSGQWRISGRASVDLSAEHFVRAGSSTGGGFDDNRIWMRLRYAPLGVRERSGT